MATLMEKRDAAVKDAEALIEKSRSGEVLTDDESAQLKSLVEDAKSLGEKIKEAESAEQLLKSFGQPMTHEEQQVAADVVRGKSLGQYFVDGQKDALSNIKARRRVQADMAEYKAAGDVTTTGNAIGSQTMTDLARDVDKNIVTQYVQRPTIADWLGAGNIAGNAITYFVEKVWDTVANGEFKTVAENTRKPGLTPPDYTEVTETLKKLAGWIKLSMEMAEDYDFLVSEINNRLLFQLLLAEEDQILNGDGTGTNVLGLLNRTGLQVATSASAADNMDAIYRAQTSVFTKTGLRVDGLVVNPADYEKLRLSKDANGQYLAGGPFTGQYGVGGVLQDPPLWGIRTIQTTAVDQGTILLGAGKAGATVYRKGGVRVEASNVDGEDFTHNRFTVLAEERLTLAVRRPDAFVNLTLSAA